jgi:hypothetical protein
LGLTEPGYLFQDVMDYYHKPFIGSSGSGMRSPHLTNSRPRVFTLFAQKMSEVLILNIPNCMVSLTARSAKSY